MSCEKWEEQIADEIGGGFSDAVKEHLGACPACVALAEGLESDRVALAAAPPDATGAEYAAMRLGIRAAIVRERRVRRYGVALAIAAAVIVGLVLLHPGVRPVTRSGAEVAGPVAPVVVAREIPAAHMVVRHLAKRRRARREEIPTVDLALLRKVTGFEAPPEGGSESPVEMRIATANPNVTIILLQAKEGSYE